MAKANEVKTHLLPVGRIINASLFEKDIYTSPQGEAGKPSYKIELAFEPGDIEGEGTFEDDLIEVACEKWGDGAEENYLHGRIRTPLLDGNKLAKRREDRGKPGDAYKDKIVIRAHTIFNSNGQDGPGGIQVWNEEDPVGPILPAQRELIYAGCYGIAAVTIGTYSNNEGDPALMLYLAAFQKTDDGERLMTPKDTSQLFKPVGRTKGTTMRRSRKG